jgi:hypothetical protein
MRSPIPREVLAALAPGPVRRRLLQRSLAASQQRERRPQAAWAAKLLLGESWWDVARTAVWAARPGRAWFAARGAPVTRRRRLTHPLRVLGVSEGR